MDDKNHDSGYIVEVNDCRSYDFILNKMYVCVCGGGGVDVGDEDDDEGIFVVIAADDDDDDVAAVLVAVLSTMVLYDKNCGDYDDYDGDIVNNDDMM